MHPLAYTAICAGVLIPLEILNPVRKQRRLRKGLICDLVHLAISVTAVPVALGFTALGAAWLSRFVPREVPAAVNDLPLWAQVAMVFLIAETMFYLAHRLVHGVPLLWRFHAIHHSSDELDFLSAVRGHPVDALIHWNLVLAPLILLELDYRIFGVYTLVFYVHSYVVHANIRLRIPVLQKIIVTPDFHHSHHERSPRHNYAGMLALLDVAFRSELKKPEEHPRCGSLDIGNNYLFQLLHPFLTRKKGKDRATKRIADH